MDNIEDMVVAAKDRLPNVTPVPPEFHSEASAHELKSRLQWGEPALTILDVRDHDTFNRGRIQGAMNMPLDQLPDLAEASLQPQRDIYIYGGDEAQTAQAVSLLRQAGFQHVAHLQGGLQAWQAVDGPIEGIIDVPDAGEYSLPARLNAFKQEKEQEKRV